MYSREEVLKIVDSCFHCYASSFRSDAEKYANDLIDYIDEERNAMKNRIERAELRRNE